jgi:hypothetical protein
MRNIMSSVRHRAAVTVIAALVIAPGAPATAAAVSNPDQAGNRCTARTISYRWDHGRMDLGYRGHDALQGILFTDNGGREFWQPSPRDQVNPRDATQTKVYLPDVCGGGSGYGYQWGDVIQGGGTYSGARAGQSRP